MIPTPDIIEKLEPGQIFVFGSNLAGVHGAGAARTAHKKFGASWGAGVGPHGFTYAIPTKNFKIKPLPIDKIREHIYDFLHYAATKPGLEFLVTKIGCGLRGLKVSEIAPFFRTAPSNVRLPKEFIEYLRTHSPNP